MIANNLKNQGADRRRTWAYFFSRLVTSANLIESSFLWIHNFTLKIVQVWPAWSARHFSIGWQFFFSGCSQIHLSMMVHTVRVRRNISRTTRLG
jgi:hypothetical protein